MPPKQESPTMSGIFFYVAVRHAWALLVAAKLAIALNLQRPVFHIDNKILATTVNMRTMIHDPGHWMLRPLADFSHILYFLQIIF